MSLASSSKPYCYVDIFTWTGFTGGVHVSGEQTLDIFVSYS